MAAVTICSDFGALKNKVCHCFHCFPIYLPWSDGTSQNGHHQKNLQTINAGEGVETREHSCTVGGNVNWHSSRGEQYGCSFHEFLKPASFISSLCTLVFDFSKLAFWANSSPRPSLLNLTSGWELPLIWPQLGLSLVIWTSFPAPSRLSSRNSASSLFFWCCCLATKLLSDSFVTPWTVACQSTEGCRLLCPWDSPGKNTGMGCHFLFQDIFPNPGIKPTPPALQADYVPLSHLGSLFFFFFQTHKWLWKCQFSLKLICCFSGFFFFLFSPYISKSFASLSVKLFFFFYTVQLNTVIFLITWFPFGVNPLFWHCL